MLFKANHRFIMIFSVKLDAPYFDSIQKTTSMISFHIKLPKDLENAIKVSHNYDLRIRYSFCLFESKERVNTVSQIIFINYILLSQVGRVVGWKMREMVLILCINMRSDWNVRWYYETSEFWILKLLWTSITYYPKSPSCFTNLNWL